MNGKAVATFQGCLLQAHEANDAFSNAIEVYMRSSTAKMWKHVHVLGMARYYLNSMSHDRQ